MDEGASPGRTNIFKKIINFLNPSSHEEDVTEEEIISMVNEGHEQGVLRASEAEMINNIFEFGDKEAKDIMTHRKNLIAIDGELSYNDAVPFIIDNSKSRYPVYLDDIDNVIGVLHIKDAFAFAQKNEVFRSSIKDIPGLIREVDFVPETLNIHTLFKMMQAKKSHMVIVVDEYGQTSGAVAMEDILEEIVGNIEDEHDEEESLIRKNADGSYTMNGLASLSDVVDLLQIPVEEDSFETLNGLLVSLLDKIPNDGETAELHAYGYDFVIRRVEDKTVREVLVRKSGQGKDKTESETLASIDKK
ncbi:MAG: hemolysin family protein [Lachnospiraceae bacterium]|nr:hemolysin family protein [Lachnospiraceae bacterium]